MPLDDKPGFDINRPRDDKLAKSAMLPTFRADQRVPMAFRIDNVDDYVSALHAQLDDTYGKAQNSLAEAAKAMGVAPPQALSYSSMAFMPDPANYGLMQWPGLNPEALRKITRDNITPVVIIRNRVDDLARYSGVSNHPWQPGWRIMMRDPSATPTAQDKADIKEAQTFIYNCSMDGSRDARERDANLISPFEMFLRSFVDDALTFDGWSIWTDMDSQDRVRAFANLPAGCIRLSLPTRGYKGNRDYFAALVDETGSPVKPFTRREMTWRIRNVRNDPSVYGYGWPECYDDKTEVLTNSGWKLFSHVDDQHDKLATMGVDTRRFEWQKPTHMIQRAYVGRMYRIKSASLDLLVTPGHRVLVHKWSDNKYRSLCAENEKIGDRSLAVITAEDLFQLKFGKSKNGNLKIPTVSLWEGRKICDQVFESPKCMPVHMSGDDYCAFMGAYLSEGYVPNNANGRNVYVGQREKSKGYEPFKEMLTRVNEGKAPYFVRGEFVICRKALAEHVKQFGRDCYTKIVPQAIMDATPEQIDMFLTYYLMGDGCTQVSHRGVFSSNRRGRNKGVYRCITTTSKRMADQLQELIQKTGYAASIHIANRGVRRYQHTSLPRKDGTVIAYDYMSETQPHYTVSWKGSLAHGFTIEEEIYSGNVHCATVPNGTLYVRRNNKAAWCGNCEMAIRLIQSFQSAIDLNADSFTKSSIPNGMLLLKGDYFNQEQIDALMREWTNMKRGVSKLWGMPVMSVPEDGDVEILNFMDMKGQEVRYKDHMNMMMGLCCLVWRFPIRRLGMFVSGNHRDNQPTQDAAIEIQGADDPGLPPLLLHVEETINPYILWTRWPRLRFGFMSKNPKEDARSFSERTKARTWGEARAESDLPKLETIYPPDMKELAQIMSNCPEDPVKAAVYGTVAVKMLEAQLGIETKGDEKSPGPTMQNQKDPAEAQGHGALGGVRRNSRREKNRAESNSNTPTGATV